MHSRLPLYKKWFEEAAAQSSQDWRLLAAIGYQESKWNPSAASPSGAVGLMQLTTQSAAALKLRNLADPQQSIFGGARYFKLVYEKIPARIVPSRIAPGSRSRLTTSATATWKMRAARAEGRPRSGLLAAGARVPAAPCR